MSIRIRKPAKATANLDSEEPTCTSSSAAEVATLETEPETKTKTKATAPTNPTNKRKEPPPEKSADTRRRTYVILSFWALILSVGLPIWWYTTTIYRAKLPLSEMMDWADGRACRPVFPLRVALQASSLQDQEAQNLLRLTQDALDDLNDFAGHHLRLELSDRGPEVDQSVGDEKVALTIRLAPGEATVASLHPEQPVLDVMYASSSIPSAMSSSSPLATFVATQLRSTFAEEQAIISDLLSHSSHPPEQQKPLTFSPEVAEAVAKRSTRTLRYAPTYHLTFSLFTGGSAPSSWEIEKAIEQYMRPVLDVLSPIHNFTIDTQVQLYATPGVQSEVLNKEDLSSFINAAEWPLSPSIGGAPTVNFIVFVGNQTIALGPPSPGADTSPGQTPQSWLIPQWGTVYLVPHDAGMVTHVSAETLRAPLLTFTTHLLSLLGAPRSGSLPLRLSTLSRIRSADLLLRASSTLGSLARLSLALPGIAIPWSVAEGVSTTIRHLRLACDGLGSQGDGCLAHARVAEAAAERAFFEKSMVGQLYFPDEHKIAVYLPLLGPVGVPLLMGLLNEVKAWLRRRREGLKGQAAGKAGVNGG